MPHIRNFVFEGKVLPSVNTITDSLSKAGLINWWRKFGFEACDKKTETSRQRGIDVHALFEDYLKGKIQDLPQDHIYTRFLLSLKNWQSKTGYVFAAVEPHLVNPEDEYHGSPDAIGHLPGDAEAWEVLDYKIKDKQADYRILMNEAAYARCNVREIEGKRFSYELAPWAGKIKRCRILTFNPETAEVHDKVYLLHETYFSDFKTCAQMYWVNKRADAWYNENCRGRI